jgi:hypothetical protein
VNRIRKILPLISHAFLSLILLMLANSIFFYHEHDLESGETIRHAHPYLSEEDEQNRDHSENELILLDLLTHAQYFLPDRVDLQELAVFELGEIVIEDSHNLIWSDCQSVVTLRGPPSLFS